MPTPMIVDTDTASDDALALIMALREPAVEVVAITVAGNVPLAQASRNALHRAAVRRRRSVHEAERPLARP
jgi:purine nucleosidase